jgi:hypothetical protein
MEIQQLESLVTQRIATIAYLSRIFQGHGMYFGTAKLPLSDIAKQFSTPSQKRRAEMLFNLGMSLGSLLRIHQRDEFLRAADNLFGQYETYCNDIQRSGLSRLISRPLKREHETWLLEIVQIPFPIDHLQIIGSVLEILNEVYCRILLLDANSSMLETAQKLDSKCWRNVFVPILKELDAVGTKLLDAHLSQINIGSL